MAVLKVADAAQPRGDIKGVDAVALYCGGNTPYVSTKADWNKQSARYRLPIWTRSHPQGAQQAQTDAAAFAKQLGVIGAPKGCLVMLDLELAVDAAYVQTFDQTMRGYGHPVAIYGSDSYVKQNPRPAPPGGYWGALWNRVAHLEPGEIGTQYASDQQLGTDYDLSEAAAGLPLWDTRPVAPPTKPTAPKPPAKPVTENPFEYRARHNLFTPVADDGVFGRLTIQALQYVLGVAQDGVFGLVSKRALQELLGVAADGNVGPVTVMALQRAVGAPADGVWGKVTTAHLQASLNAGRFW